MNGKAVDPAPAQVSLRLTQAEGNLVIAALAECPFKLVYELIGKLNGQANASGADACQYRLQGAEVKLILNALGQLPYQQVHSLMEALQQQLRAQLLVAVDSPPVDSKAGGRARKEKR